jgi:GntR family transcriptional regulator
MVDHSSDRAVYRQIANDLGSAILSGRLPDGARVPSEERLCQEHGVSRTTARKAIEVLKGEGLVDVRAPRGTFVRSAPLRETVQLRRGDRVWTRIPIPEERLVHDIKQRIPLLIITRVSGRRSSTPVTGRRPNRARGASEP